MTHDFTTRVAWQVHPGSSWDKLRVNARLLDSVLTTKTSLAFLTSLHTTSGASRNDEAARAASEKRRMGKKTHPRGSLFFIPARAAQKFHSLIMSSPAPSRSEAATQSLILNTGVVAGGAVVATGFFIPPLGALLLVGGGLAAVAGWMTSRGLKKD